MIKGEETEVLMEAHGWEKDPAERFLLGGVRDEPTEEVSRYMLWTRKMESLSLGHADQRSDPTEWSGVLGKEGSRSRATLGWEGSRSGVALDVGSIVGRSEDRPGGEGEAGGSC